MALTFVRDLNGDFDRQIQRFLMSDGNNEIVCAVTYTVLRDLTHNFEPRIDERIEQFHAFQTRIMDAASRKYHTGKTETGSDPLILVTRNDIEI